MMKGNKHTDTHTHTHIHTRTYTPTPIHVASKQFNIKLLQEQLLKGRRSV